MWHSIGKVTVTTAGTLVQVTDEHAAAQTILFQALAGNTGCIYICSSSTASKTTLVGVLAVLAAPTLTDEVATTLPTVMVSVYTAPAPLDLQNLWVDSDEDGDGCLVSYVRN